MNSLLCGGNRSFRRTAMGSLSALDAKQLDVTIRDGTDMNEQRVAMTPMVDAADVPPQERRTVAQQVQSLREHETRLSTADAQGRWNEILTRLDQVTR